MIASSRVHRIFNELLATIDSRSLDTERSVDEILALLTAAYDNSSISQSDFLELAYQTLCKLDRLRPHH